MAPNYALRRAVVLVGVAGLIWGTASGVNAVAGLIAPPATPAVVTAADALTQPDAPQPAPTTAAPDAQAPQPAPAPPAPPAPITGTDPVTISFAGDTHFANQLAPVAADPQGLAGLKPYLSGADITVLNLETAITATGAPLGGKQFTFAAPPSALTTLAEAGVDVVSMANNHAVDFGSAGLKDTLAAKASSPVKIAGIGANKAEAFAPAVTVVDGVSVAVLAATQLREQTTAGFTAGETKPGVASMVELDAITAAVRDAAARYDVVVVVPHWGTEKELCPTAPQTTAAQRLAEAGADIVVGGHSHRVMGSGWQGNTYVGYGLGNFVWFLNTTFPGRSTGVLTLDIDKAAVQARRGLPPAERGKAGSVVAKDAWQPLSIPTSGIPVADPATADQMRADRAAVQGCSKLATARPGAASAPDAAAQPPNAQPPAAQPAAPAPGAAKTAPAKQPARDTPYEFKGVPVISSSFPLTKNYTPAWSKETDGLKPEVRAALNQMFADAKAAKMPLAVRSGYRSWAVQDASFKRAYAKYGEGARRYYAEAGHSEHQTGLSLDLSDGTSMQGYKFAATKQAGWVAANAARYGFIIRYPEGKRHITGVDHEPWHIRYVGVEVAAAMAKTPGITLEEYLGLV